VAVAAERLQVIEHGFDLAHFGLFIDGRVGADQKARGFGDKLLEALERMWPPRKPQMMVDEQQVDGSLYDSFVKDEDKTKMSVVRAAKPDELSNLNLDFQDGRLRALLPLYKARNFPETLTETEHQVWVRFRRQKLLGNDKLADRFFKQIKELNRTPGLNTDKKHILRDAEEYGQSIIQAI